MATILVVDDDGAVRSMVARMLSGAGHAVHTAANGAEALEVMEATSPDVVLTDLFMPEKDGVELILELARQPTRPTLIAMSGGGMLLDTTMLDMAGRLGAVRTLPKPFSKEDLLATVDEALAA